MSSFTFWRKVLRPEQAFLGALATWVVAVLSDGNDWVGLTKMAAACIVALNIVGASVFHYGAARRMYARKEWDRIEVRKPGRLIALGSLLFLASSSGALVMLPAPCFWITVGNAVAISCYAWWLAKHWITKNVIIALVCTTPVIIGWLSGHKLHPALPYLALATFFAYWTREIVKDYLDIKANEGIRVTLPLWLGHKHAHRALYVAAGTALLTSSSLMSFGQVMASAPALATFFYVLAISSFLAIAYWLAQRIYVRKLPMFITYGNGLLLVSAFCLKAFAH